MDGYSKDIVKEDIEKLKSIFPQCVVEGKVKIDQLLNILGEYDEKDFEKYEFTWKGKNECYKVARERTKATLLPCESESVNFNDTENLYIEGDNLEVLKILQQGYYNKIKMIYIDPPYNTGNDFVYKDNYKNSLENYKKIVSSLGKSNPETSGRFHTDWLNMMFPRLMLAHTLLKDDGVIFISIDDNEVDNLKKLCNEIFGEENYRNTIITRRRVKSLNSQFSDKGLYSLNIGYEYILVYSKTNKFLMNALYAKKNNVPTKGRWDVFWSNADRPTMRYEILGFTPKTGQWRYSKEKAIIAVNNYNVFLNEFSDKMSLEEYWKNTGCNLQFIRRIENGTGKNGGVQHWIPPTESSLRTNNWLDIEVSQINKEIDVSFNNPKNKELIMELIKLNISKEDIILDFFSGSATTAHAVMQLNAEDGGNRKYIMVQLPQLCDEKTEAYKNGYKNICEIGKERIRRAGAKIKEEMENTENLDIGFRVFKLDSTNFNKWNVPLTTEEDLQQFLNNTKTIVNGRTEVDAIFEILIKNGFPLTEKIYSLDIDNYKFYYISEDCLVMICFEENIPIEVVEKAIEYAPSKMVFSRKAFKDTSEMVTAKHIIGKEFSYAQIEVEFL